MEFFLYRVTLGCELVLTILGGILYVAYSIVDKSNQLYADALSINSVYVTVSVISVVLGFLSRSLKY